MRREGHIRGAHELGDLHGARRSSGLVHNDGPLLRRLVEGRVGGDRRLEPDVELHDFCTRGVSLQIATFAIESVQCSPASKDSMKVCLVTKTDRHLL